MQRITLVSTFCGVRTRRYGDDVITSTTGSIRCNFSCIPPYNTVSKHNKSENTYGRQSSNFRVMKKSSNPCTFTANYDAESAHAKA